MGYGIRELIEIWFAHFECYMLSEYRKFEKGLFFRTGSLTQKKTQIWIQSLQMVFISFSKHKNLQYDSLTQLPPIDMTGHIQLRNFAIDHFKLNTPIAASDSKLLRLTPSLSVRSTPNWAGPAANTMLPRNTGDKNCTTLGWYSTERQTNIQTWHINNGYK